METTFSPESINKIFAYLSKANQAFMDFYPGDRPARQPIHTVYGGAQIFRADFVSKLGAVAIKSLEEYAPDAKTLAAALAIPFSESSEIIYKRVVEKLRREPVEDFRVDFEDGFGNRPDPEEDAAAEASAKEMAQGLKDGILSPYIGIRIKPFTEELKARSVRTLDIFLTTLLKASAGKLPANFVVTLPKVTIPEQTAALVSLLEAIEAKHGLGAGSLKLEIMIETTQSIITSSGLINVPLIAAAAKGRCVAAHFGTYDYTASCNLTAAYQTMDHSACNFAREVQKVSLAGTGIWISDGATNVMPVGPHRAAKDGPGLSEKQIQENRAAVHSAWRLGYSHIRHSLENGYYQGWDLHPAQFPIRYAACYGFFLEGFKAASERLKNFIEKAAQATLVGNVFDDAATGQGLLNYFLRALNCGAITEAEAVSAGITLDELRGRSFLKILENRRGSGS